MSRNISVRARYKHQVKKNQGSKLVACQCKLECTLHPPKITLPAYENLMTKSRRRSCQLQYSTSALRGGTAPSPSRVNQQLMSHMSILYNHLQHVKMRTSYICLKLIQTPNLLTEPRTIRHSYQRAMLVLEHQDFTLTKYRKI